MPNPYGTYPANIVGYNENPDVGPALASDMSTRLTYCEWEVNKGAASGYCGLDGSSLVPQVNINMAALIAAIPALLPTTLPSSAGVLWNNGGILSIS